MPVVGTTATYADGTPKPRLRGRVHLAGAVALALGALWAGGQGEAGWTLALSAKTMTYAASAFLHLFPFSSARSLRAAHAVDLVCIPLTTVGTVALFVRAEDVVREACVAAWVLVANAVVVAWQVWPQTGTREAPPGRQAVRVGVVVLYSTWALTFAGVRAGLGQPGREKAGALWAFMVATSVLTTLSYWLATRRPAGLLASDRGYRGDGPFAVPWHGVGLWGHHEDMHVLVAAGDLVCVLLASELRRS